MKNLIITILLLSNICLLTAQKVNPFERIGKEGEVITLSQGKYNEAHLDDTLQRIGSVIVNMNTGTIYQLLDIDTLYSEATLDPTVISRWYSVDPITKSHESPYAGFSNNPIWFLDPDGRDTLMMHRSDPIEHYTEFDERVLIYKVTFSVIRDGVEEHIDQTMYMMGNRYKYELKKDHNYTLKWLKMNRFKSNPNFDNSIHVAQIGDGIFIHPGNVFDDFKGCLGITCEEPVKNKSWGMYDNIVTISETSNTLQKVRDLYNKTDEKGKLTGDKFVLKTSSISEPTPLSPMKKMPTLSPKSINQGSVPTLQIPSTSGTSGSSGTKSEPKPKVSPSF